MKNSRSLFFTIIIVLCILLASCNKLPKGVESALKLSGNNEPALQKVISHYKKLKDHKKLLAAYYLIENMPGKGWVEYKPYFINGKPAPYYLFNYSNNDTIHLRKKQMEDSAGSAIVYNVAKVVEDIKVIKADFIIENIEYAFDAWKQPWAKHLNFNQFCEYLLPYRFGTEPLQSWRKQTAENMYWLKDSMRGQETDLLKACTIVNDSIKRSFSYKHYELDFYPFILSYEEVNKLKGGRCDDLNLVAAYWMRSIGIPVINDFTPVWANSNFGGHTWLSLLLEKGKHIPFNAAYDNPIIDSLPFKNQLCKVYRRQYKKQAGSFRSQFPKEADYPGYLFTNNYYDVTAEYLVHKDAEVPIFFNTNYKKPFAYLGVLCEKNWSIVDFGKVTNGKINFKNLGINTIYMAFFSNKDSFQILSNPFLINDKLEVVYLNADSLQRTTVEINISKDYWWLRKDRTYQLTYWHNQAWKNIGPGLIWKHGKWEYLQYSPDSVTDSTIRYCLLPKNAVFRFQNIEPIFDIGSFGRPFLITKNGYSHF